MIQLVPGVEEGGPQASAAARPDPAAQASTQGSTAGDVPAADLPPVDLLIPVHNEWHVLRPCLESIERFTNYPGLRVTLLDDGSDAFVQRHMQAWVARGTDEQPRHMLRNDRALGFVRNSNRGLQASDRGYVVLLNSDTVVTPGWLHRLVDAADSDSTIGCVMPMSNQCSFHSLRVPMGWNIFQYAADVGRRIVRTCYDAVTVGGFCVLFRRGALDDVGLFDEAFGRGYGEESDWCMRARSRGWRVVGSEDTFVYHRGRVSFKDFKDQTFREGNYRLFMQRWGDDYKRAMAAWYGVDALRPLREAYVRMDGSVPPPILAALVDRVKMGGPVYAATEARRYVRDQGGLGRMTSVIRERGLVRRGEATQPHPRGFVSRARPRIVYVLEKFSISGGVLSVVQLVNRLTLLGWDAKIATHHDHDQTHLGDYMLYHEPYVFPSAEAMIADFPPTDIAVATLWSTAHKLGRILDRTRESTQAPAIVPWYFVQDDETGFFDKRDKQGPQAVHESYDVIPNKIVKTDWLADLLTERGHASHKIPLGLDLDLFYPQDPDAPRSMRIIGMARPRTPRRGFAALVDTFRAVKRARPQVEVCFYGCTNLADHELDFEHTDLGLVPHERLRALYNEASILVDTSSFQGFGRMGLEAMACGCATVLTKFGGINEYARDGENCLQVDPAEREATLAAVLRVIDDEALRRRLVLAGLDTAQDYSCDAEARRTSRLFAASLGVHADEHTGAVFTVRRPDGSTQTRSSKTTGQDGAGA